MKKNVLVMLIVVICSTVSFGAPIHLESTVQQGEWYGLNFNPVPIATFDFGQPYSQLDSISSLTVKFRLWDGDSNPGEFDYNHLTLLLDGVNTGLFLNGFPTGKYKTNTFTYAVNSSLSNLLIQALADGKLKASIADKDFNGLNYMEVPNGKAKLTIDGNTAVPAPSALLICSIGSVFVSYLRRKTIV